MKVKFNLFLSIICLLILQSCDVVEDCEVVKNKTGNEMPAKLSAIQTDVFDKSCSESGCHGGQYSNYPILDKGNSLEELLKTTYQSGTVGLPLVKPGSADSSYLIKKITGIGMADGSSMMPQNKSPLSQAKIDSIRAWINNGAKND